MFTLGYKFTCILVVGVCFELLYWNWLTALDEESCDFELPIIFMIYCLETITLIPCLFGFLLLSPMT